MRFYASILFVFLMTPIGAAAQDAALPGRGDVLELRSDDSRCSEGHRCFIAGPGGSIRQMLDRVNGDIEDPSLHVTVAQLDDANQCRVIYHRPDGSMLRNGICPEANGTRERVTWDEHCSGGRCVRWTVASIVYRVPAARRLTPGEEAERIAETPGTTPDELRDQGLTLARGMRSDQPPSLAQASQALEAIANAIPAVGSSEPASTRARDADSTATPTDDAPEASPATAMGGADMSEPGAEGVDTSEELPADAVTISPIVYYGVTLIMFGLILMCGVLGMLYIRTKRQIAALTKAKTQLENTLSNVEHDNDLSNRWKEVFPMTPPTKERLKEMMDSHVFLSNLERYGSWNPAWGKMKERLGELLRGLNTGWTPAFGDVSENIETVLTEVSESRSLKQAVMNALPGTNAQDPDAVFRAIKGETDRIRAKAGKNRDLERELRQAQAESEAIQMESERGFKRRIAELEEDLAIVRADNTRKAAEIGQLETRYTEALAEKLTLEAKLSTHGSNGSNGGNGFDRHAVSDLLKDALDDLGTVAEELSTYTDDNPAAVRDLLKERVLNDFLWQLKGRVDRAVASTDALFTLLRPSLAPARGAAGLASLLSEESAGFYMEQPGSEEIAGEATRVSGPPLSDIPGEGTNPYGKKPEKRDQELAGEKTKVMSYGKARAPGNGQSSIKKTIPAPAPPGSPPEEPSN